MRSDAKSAVVECSSRMVTRSQEAPRAVSAMVCVILGDDRESRSRFLDAL